MDLLFGYNDLIKRYLIIYLLVWAIIIIIYIIIQYNVAKHFEQYAFDKGYGEDEHIFWWCFFLLPIGAAMVIAMPNKKLVANQIDQINLKKWEMMQDKKDPVSPTERNK